MTVGPAGQVPAQRSNAEFEQLFREIFRPLAGMALSLSGITPEEAEDAAEMALQEVLQRWAMLDNPRAYAYKATISNVLKIKRTQVRHAQAVRRKIRRGDFQPEAHADPGLMEVEYRQWVMTLLDSLPHAQREAVALCLVDELSPAEAGELLGKTGAALRQALHAGREALRRRIADEAAAEATAPATRAEASTIPAVTAGRKEDR
jgi:DNA-directed RNA polymerase specialized sigma24 family protein